jgi:hypothetical protein
MNLDCTLSGGLYIHMPSLEDAMNSWYTEEAGGFFSHEMSKDADLTCCRCGRSSLSGQGANQQQPVVVEGEKQQKQLAGQPPCPASGAQKTPAFSQRGCLQQQTKLGEAGPCWIS